MHSTQRSSLWGTIKNILIIILIPITVVTIIHSKNKQTELKEMNDVLSATVNEQTSTINNLETENIDLNNYISLLQEEKNKLRKENSKLKKTLEKNKESSPQPTTTIGGSFKSYTDYNYLSKSSAQWKLQEKAYTDKNGLRKIGDAYLVALGSYYGTTLGTKYKVTLSSGNTFQIILCDCKNDAHTDSNNQICLSNGSILEFYVDTSVLPESVKISGSISSIDFFSGDVASIVKVK